MVFWEPDIELVMVGGFGVVEEHGFRARLV